MIYDIGSRDARGRYSFGSPPPGARLFCVDIAPGPGVDIVADAHDLHMIDSTKKGLLTESETTQVQSFPPRMDRGRGQCLSCLSHHSGEDSG